MAARTLPGLGLQGFWALGEDGWKDGMDANLRKLSALCQARINSRQALEPAGATNGDIYLLTGGANNKKLALRDDGAWVYLDPVEGFTVWDLNTDSELRYDGTNWVDVSSVASSSGGLIVTTFTSSGTWTKSTNNPKSVFVEVVGGGGGSSKYLSSGANWGRSGAYARKFIRGSDLAETISVTVGAGGAGAPYPGGDFGSAGGTSSFGSHITVTGGGASSYTVVGSPSTVSGADLAIYPAVEQAMLGSTSDTAPGRGGQRPIHNGAPYSYSGNPGIVIVHEYT